MIPSRNLSSSLKLKDHSITWIPLVPFHYTAPIHVDSSFFFFLLDEKEKTPPILSGRESVREWCDQCGSRLSLEEEEE